MRLAPEGPPTHGSGDLQDGASAHRKSRGRVQPRESRVGLRVPEARLHLIFWPPNPQGPTALLVRLQAGWNRAPSATPGLMGGPCAPGAIPSHQGRA